MSRVAANGFTMLSTLDLVRVDVLEKCGFQPRMENTQVGISVPDMCVVTHTVGYTALSGVLFACEKPRVCIQCTC